jgi:hypothetical protein
MKDTKLRLDYLFSIGIKLAEGDEYNYLGMEVILRNNDLATTNKPTTTDNERFITSFAPRKNKGVQPVGDSVPVTAILNGFESEPEKSIAAGFNWIIEGVTGDIETWMPNLNELIKMQIEHDKQKATSSAANDPNKIGDIINGKQVKPRTKTEYIGLHFIKKWEAVKFMEETGESLFYISNNEYIELFVPESAIKKVRQQSALYRKVETEITWQSELKLFLDESNHIDGGSPIETAIEHPKSKVDRDWDNEFVQMCRVVVDAVDNKEVK